jgi:hypothetical protein
MSDIMNVCEVWENCVWRYTVIYLIIYEGTNCEDMKELIVKMIWTQSDMLLF